MVTWQSFGCLVIGINIEHSLIELDELLIVVGMVHAWVGQKLVKSNFLQVLFLAPKLQSEDYFTYSDT